MEKTSCIAREKSIAGYARHTCAPSLMEHAPCLCDRGKTYELGKGCRNTEQVKLHALSWGTRGITSEALFPRHARMLAFLPCERASMRCVQSWIWGWCERDRDGLGTQKTHQPAPCLASAPVSPQERLRGRYRRRGRLWWGRGSFDWPHNSAHPASTFGFLAVR
jgi:hypothetical protein